jgi:hypothetical protein
MARYQLTQKIGEFTHHASMLVGQHGWQGRLTASWNAKREEFSEGKTLGSQKNYIVKFRNAIKEWFASLPVNDPRRALEEKTLAIISFPDGMLETLNRDYNRAVKKRAENLILVRQPDALVLTFVEWLKSTDVRQKALGVMGLTGRRFIEVVKTGTFRPVVEKVDRGTSRMKFVVEFEGQAKTREAVGSMHGVSYRIPVVPAGKIDTVPLVLEAMAEIRASKIGERWQTYDYVDLNAGESGRFNGQLRGSLSNVEGMTDELLGKLSVKWLRALYAELAYARFGSLRKTKSAFFAQILGHAEDDLKTSLSYMVLALGDDESAIEKAKAEVQRLLDAVRNQMNEEKAAKRAAGNLVEDDDDDDVVIENEDMD